VLDKEKGIFTHTIEKAASSQTADKSFTHTDKRKGLAHTHTSTPAPEGEEK